MTLSDETLVREALHHAADDLTAPVPRLTSAATRAGRTLRRRRRAVTTAGALAAAVLVGVPTALLLGGTGPTATAPPVATDPTPSVVQSSATADPTPEQTPHLVDNDAWSRMPAPDMLDVLSGELTTWGMTTTDEVLTNTDSPSGTNGHDLRGWLEADLVEDAHSVGAVNVALMVTGLSPDRFTCPGNLTSITSCTEILDDSGQTIGRRSVTTTGDVVVNEVVLQHRNGGFVYAAASNSTDDKWGIGSSTAGSTVPLTLDQLQTIAADDVWTAWEPPAGSGH